MKKLLLIGCALFATYGYSQTTIYQETFETGNTFSLNTSDLGAANTSNTWLMNNVYSGGSGTFTCLGFPFSFTVTNTPSQPGAITGSPSSNYLHITAQAAITSGINCASFVPSDGTCVFDESNFSKMTSPISTLGFTGVEFDFWWMCAGSATAFGELYYSLDGGVTWVLKQSNMNNVTNWSQTVIADPAWDNQASIMFAFRFVNTTAASAADPSFCIDEITVTGVAATNDIVTGIIQPTSWCFGSTLTVLVPFTATGTLNGGNSYSAELSDASGSFAVPIVIGTLSSSASGPLMITGVVSGITPVGTAYRIRVVASDPSTIGTDNGTDLIIHPLPTVTLSPFASSCVNGGSITLTGGAPSGGDYSGTGVSMGSFDTGLAGVGTHSITYYYIDANGCDGSAVETIEVNDSPVVAFASIPDLCATASPYTMTEGTPAGGTYSGPGVTGNDFDPATAGVGTWTLLYDYTDANGCSGQSVQTVLVDDCLGMTENTEIAYSIFPNPTENNFTVVSEVEFDAIKLIDLNGRILRTFNSNEQVDVSEFSSGVYIIEIEYLGQRYAERMMIK